MKAVVLEAPNKLTYTDIPNPEPVGEQPISVRIAAAGVCGSDLLRFAKNKAYHYPLVLGHEFSAVVEDAPADSHFSTGDRVAVFPLIPDLRDPYAAIGEFAVSKGYDYFGSRRHGAFSERLLVPEFNLIPVPDHVTLLEAAAVEPAAVSLHAMLKFKIPPNATALVIGAGPIGAFAAQWLKILGCSRVFVAELDERKLEIMQQLGMEPINAGKGDTVEQVKALTDGRGVDLSVEASGIPKTFMQAIEAAGVFGQVMMLGDLSGDVQLPAAFISSILRRELTLYGTWNSKITPVGKSEWEMVLAHMGKDLHVNPLISHVLLLSDGPEIFNQMATRSTWYNKVMFAVADEAQSEADHLPENVIRSLS